MISEPSQVRGPFVVNWDESSNSKRLQDLAVDAELKAVLLSEDFRFLPRFFRESDVISQCDRSSEELRKETEVSRCVLGELVESGRLWITHPRLAYLRELSFEDYQRLQNLFEQVHSFTWLHEKSSKMKALRKKLRALREEINPYSEHAKPGKLAADAVLSLEEFRETKGQGPRDIRKMELIRKTFTDEKTKKTINHFMRSQFGRHGLEKAGPVLSRFFPKKKRQQKSESFKQALELVYKLSYLGQRIPDYHTTQTRLLARLEAELGQSVTAVEKGGSTELPRLTIDEAWLYDQSLKLAPFVAELFKDLDPNLSAVQNARVEYLIQEVMDRNYALVEKSRGNFGQDVFKELRTGDILLENREKKRQYLGGNLTLSDKVIRFLLGSKMLHSALFVRGVDQSPELFHLLDIQKQESDVAFTHAKMGDPFFYTGYRFVLHRLIREDQKERLVHFIREKVAKTGGVSGIDPAHAGVLSDDELVQAYLTNLQDKTAQEYYAKARAEFAPTEPDQAPLMKIKNPREFRNLMILRPSEWRKYPNLAKRAEDYHDPEQSRFRNGLALEQCAEFTVVESIRYLNFMDRKIREDLSQSVELSDDSPVIRIPYRGTIHFSGVSPGTLERIYEKWVARGMMEKIVF